MVGREILGSTKQVFADDSTDTVDLQNFEACMIVWTGSSGVISESDSSATGYTTVAAADLIQEEGAQPPGQPWAVAYKGSKRYLRSVEDALFILGNPRHVPTYDNISAVKVRSSG
jgi:hypothetical protein